MEDPYHNFIANGLVAHNCGFGRYQCAFRGVCSADPAIRPTLLETNFTRRVWDPLLPR